MTTEVQQPICNICNQPGLDSVLHGGFGPDWDEGEWVYQHNKCVYAIHGWFNIPVDSNVWFNVVTGQTLGSRPNSWNRTEGERRYAEINANGMTCDCHVVPSDSGSGDLLHGPSRASSPTAPTVAVNDQ